MLFNLVWVLLFVGVLIIGISVDMIEVVEDCE